jgi:20S proteasome subunit alpha 2
MYRGTMAFTSAQMMAVFLCLLLNQTLLWETCCVNANPSGSSNNFQGVDGRYSFSLTTFDTTGKLRQVEYATQASMMGPTLLAAKIMHSEDEDVDDESEPVAVFVTRQTSPLHSPLVRDNGTPRFVHIHPQVVLTHTGISADGRILLAEIQQSVIEYEYTFDEIIPLERLLGDLSLLMQRYTMKAGVRPFGCSILVTYLPERERGAGASMQQQAPQFYRVDPSGAVVLLEGDVVALGSGSQTGGIERHTSNWDQSPHPSNVQEMSSRLQKSLVQTQQRGPTGRTSRKPHTYRGHTLTSHYPILAATFSRSSGLVVKRVLQREEE